MRLLRRYLSKNELCRESNKSAETGRQEMVAFRRIFAYAKLIASKLVFTCNTPRYHRMREVGACFRIGRLR